MESISKMSCHSFRIARVWIRICLQCLPGCRDMYHCIMYSSNLEQYHFTCSAHTERMEHLQVKRPVATSFDPPRESAESKKMRVAGHGQPAFLSLLSKPHAALGWMPVDCWPRAPKRKKHLQPQLPHLGCTRMDRLALLGSQAACARAWRLAEKE